MGRGLLRWSLKPNISSVARLLAFVTGLINQELLLKNEYLLAENRILKAHLQPGFRLSRPERTALAEIGKRLGRKLLQQVASVANPDTILGGYRKLVAAQFDGSRQRRLPGRPRIAAEIEDLVVRLARENSGWGYDRIVGALANLGYTVSDQTVGNVLRRHGIAPAPKRSQTTTWKDFLQSHMAVLAGIDFFTVEALTLARFGDVLRVVLYSSGESPGQSRRNHTASRSEMDAANGAQRDWRGLGFLDQRRYVLHDRDTKFCSLFRETLKAGGIKLIQLPARSPNLNAYAERWVRSVKEECLSKLILIGEASLRRALQQYLLHYHEERSHQGKENRILFPSQTEARRNRGAVRCRERLGGVLKHYEREAA